MATSLCVLSLGPLPAWAKGEALPACAAADLVLREVGSPDGPGSTAGTVFAVKNGGAAACRISGGVGARLYDERGDDIGLRAVPRTAMAMLLTLEPGAEASFTVDAAPLSAKACRASARIEVFVPGLAAPLSAPASIEACPGAAVRVSTMQLGVPPVSGRGSRLPLT